MNQAINPSPNFFQTGLLLVLVAAIAGAGSYGLYRYAGAVDEQAVATDTQAVGQVLGGENPTLSNRSTEASISKTGANDREQLRQPATAPPSSAIDSKTSIAASSPKEPSVALPDFAVPLDPSEFETECERFVEELATRQPDNPLALNVVAMYYSQMQQTTKADELWKKCVALAPKDVIYYVNWATNFLNRSESEKALEVIDQAISNGLAPSMFTYQRALSLAALSRDSEVEELIKREFDAGDKNPSLMLLLGQSQIKLGKIPEAKASLESAKAGGVFNKALVNGLLTCSVRLKEKESIEVLRKELESFAGDQQEFGQKQFDRRSEVEMRRFGLGIVGESIEVLRRAGELGWAESVGLRAIFLDPKNVDVYRLMADVYRDKAEPQNAMVVYERICSLQPTDVLNHLFHARAAADAGHREKAEGILKYAIALAPLDPACFSSMGEFLLEQGRAKEAVWYVRQAVKLDPSREGRLLFIRALKEAGELDAANEQEKSLNSNRELPRVKATP